MSLYDREVYVMVIQYLMMESNNFDNSHVNGSAVNRDVAMTSHDTNKALHFIKDIFTLFMPSY